MSDEEVEKAMLFYLIFHQEQYSLTEKDFTTDRHKMLIKAINQLKAENKPISMLGINEKIKRKGVLEYLSNLGEYLTLESAETIYSKIKEYTKKRELFELLKENQMKLEEQENIDLCIENLISKMQKIEFQTEKDSTFLNQVVDTIKNIESNINKKEDYSLYTGYLGLDSLTDGLHGGELTIIGARPGVGKTTFALQLAEYIARKGKYIAYVSLEMSANQMIQKLISMRTSVNSRKIRNGDMTEQEFTQVGEDCSKIADLPFQILTKINTIQGIELNAKRLKNSGKLDVLIIDYLQLLKNAGKFNSREQEVADMSRTLKLLSLELEIPIIALCQLNRNASKSEPTLADIRESGSIEQDADNVIFLYQKNSETNIVTVDLQKQRAGNVGSLELKFLKNISKFKDVI